MLFEIILICLELDQRLVFCDLWVEELILYKHAPSEPAQCEVSCAVSYWFGA